MNVRMLFIGLFRNASRKETTFMVRYLSLLPLLMFPGVLQAEQIMPNFTMPNQRWRLPFGSDRWRPGVQTRNSEARESVSKAGLGSLTLPGRHAGK